MNISYLLGAGASAETLPTVESFKKVMNLNYLSVVKEIEPVLRFKDFQVSQSYIDQLTTLIDQISTHRSVDTLAKKLFLRGDTAKYRHLKLFVNHFLTFREFEMGIDKRYDGFFASILSNEGAGIKLPGNIKILSWNYDRQIELSVAQFMNSNKLMDIANKIQLYPRENISSTNLISDQFSCFKLNGTIGGIIKNGIFKLPDIDTDVIGKSFSNEERIKTLRNFIDEYELFMVDNNSNSSISYSWENHVVTNHIRKNALEATKETDILVVIGYSFPTFNRETDRSILSNMKKLRKVYIQSKGDSIKGVRQRFEALTSSHKTNVDAFSKNQKRSTNHPNAKPDPGIEIQELTDIGEFFIPFEFA